MVHIEIRGLHDDLPCFGGRPRQVPLLSQASQQVLGLNHEHGCGGCGSLGIGFFSPLLSLVRLSCVQVKVHDFKKC